MSLEDDDNDTEEPLHVLDLPQLYTKPSAQTLRSTLEQLRQDSPSWATQGLQAASRRAINPEGLTSYLTRIIASPLSWIEDAGEQEATWELASARLTERSGRSARSQISRTFEIASSGVESVSIRLTEPSLTADNLGLKTWAAAYCLAQRLESLKHHLASCPEVLELGSGTGLVGLAAAMIWSAKVHLTDLPPIVPNLESNAADNNDAVVAAGGSVSAAVLDWSDYVDGRPGASRKYPIILVADPLYSPEHPRLLVGTISAWLARVSAARVVVELPLREAYSVEVHDFVDRMAQTGLEIIDQGKEVGYDDWSTGRAGSDELTEVKCWWSVWKWKSEKQDGI